MSFRTPVLALLLAAACASSPNGTDSEAAGCYYFVQDATARQLSLPWGVRLTPDSLAVGSYMDDQPDTYQAVTLRDYDETASFPFGYWQPRPGDSVRVGYPGMGGFVLNLARQDTHLEGVAVSVGDAGLGPRPSHPVRLDRARCPGE